MNKRFKNIKCIPSTSEKFVTFSVNNLEFIDSMSFLQASLESLVMNLSGDKRDEEKEEMSKSEKEELRKKILGT